MGEQIMAEGATVGISQEWAEYLDKFTDIAGALFGVFFVVLVILLVAWLGIGAFTHLNKTRVAQRVFGTLTVAALAGCLVSTVGWTINSSAEGGAGLGSIEVSGGEQQDVELEGYEPKQWSVEDVQGESETEEEEAEKSPPSEEPTTEPPGDGKDGSKDGAPCVPNDGQNNLAGIVGTAFANPCKDQ